MYSIPILSTLFDENLFYRATVGKCQRLYLFYSIGKYYSFQTATISKGVYADFLDRIGRNVKLAEFCTTSESIFAYCLCALGYDAVVAACYYSVVVCADYAVAVVAAVIKLVVFVNRYAF